MDLTKQRLSRLQRIVPSGVRVIHFVGETTAVRYRDAVIVALPQGADLQ